VPGTLTYSPVAGAVPGVGTDTLSVTFTPFDNIDYRSTSTEVALSVLSPTPSPTPSPSPSPTPSPTPTPTPTATPTPVPTQTMIIGEQPVFRRKLKKGKATGKAVLSGFTLDFSVPLNAAAAANAVNYQVDTITTKKVKKKKETILHPIAKFTVSYLASSDAVEITLGANETFPTGGQITVLGGLTTSAGGTLNGTAVFTIAKGGRSVGPT
jgi:hypothetical protein